MFRKALILAAVLSLFTMSYANNGQEALASHTDIFIPSFQIEPKSPITGQGVTFIIVVTNNGNNDMTNATLSLALDGKWEIDNLHVNVPAKKSIRVSFTAGMPVSPGQHQLKVCPERKTLGDNGDQCNTVDFTAIDASTVAVVILAPKEEEVLKGNATIRVAALGKEAQKVELYVQDQLAYTKNQQPFDFTLDTTKYEDGRYKVYAIAYYDSGPSIPSAVKKYLIDNSESMIVTVKLGQVGEGTARFGQKVVITSEITNNMLNSTALKLAATFIVLVKDTNGYTVSLSWTEDRIGYGETVPMSQSWTPEANGVYAVDIFLWDTVENAVPLADVMKATVTVS